MPLPRPVNMVLYDLLNLQSWTVSNQEIKVAYRQMVVVSHPDKVPEEQRAEATEMMQKLNGAKDVLLDDEKRRQYHVDGLLPWAA